MRNEPVDHVAGQIVTREHLGRALRHARDRKFVNGRAFLMNVMKPLGHRLGARWHAAATGFLVEMLHPRPIRADQGIENSISIRARLHEHGTRAISEEHASRAIGVVDDRRHLICADDDDFSVLARADEMTRNRQSVDETRTGGLNVETADIANADHIADEIGRGWKDQVWRGGRADQEVDVLGSRVGALKEPAYRFGRHMRGAKPLSLEEPPFLDAGPVGDPRVARVDHAREFGIGQNIVGNVTVHTGDRRPNGKMHCQIRSPAARTD